MVYLVGYFVCCLFGFVTLHVLGCYWLLVVLLLLRIGCLFCVVLVGWGLFLIVG